MKRIVLTLAALMLVAGTALAYVQPSNLSLTQPQSTTPNVAPNTDDNTASAPPEVASGPISPGTDVYRRNPDPRPPKPPVGGATKPVPEPGTMMLASMGLLALGAAMRRRHP